jgi:hypothetical protein
MPRTITHPISRRDRAAITSVKSRQHSSRSTRPRSTRTSWASRFTSVHRESGCSFQAEAKDPQLPEPDRRHRRHQNDAGPRSGDEADRRRPRQEGGDQNAGHRHPYPRARPDLRGCREEDRRWSALCRRATDRPFQQGSGVSRLSRQARAADSSAVERRTPRSSVRTRQRRLWSSSTRPWAGLDRKSSAA